MLVAPRRTSSSGSTDASATKATTGDLLEPLDGSTLSEVPERYLLTGDGADLLAPIDTGDVCMNIDSAWFDEHDIAEPRTLDQLAEATWKDLTVVSSPVTSSPGLAFLVGTVDRYGEDGWGDFWTRLRDNGVRVRPSWDDAYYNDYTVSGGDRPIVLSYASSPPAEVVFSEGTRAEPASTVMLDSCTSQVEYAGILAGTPEPELAAELVAFMLSDTWQGGLALSNFVFPVIDVALPEEFVRWAPRPEDPMKLDAAVIAAGRDRWIESWRELME
ncbi:MAG: thiamine ABC transporter substrate-binding protein [Microthrixaceae bacterium]